jgi:uncharacterized protein
MKLALFGARGMIGSRLLTEALRRGHSVTAVVRDPHKYLPPSGKVTVVQGDALDIASVASATRGHDAVLTAIGGSGDVVKEVVRPLLEGLTTSGVKRLVVTGGAGSLEVDPGVQLMDTAAFPQAWKGTALAHYDALKLYRQNTTIDWSYISPAAFIAPGERTGKFRLGGDQLITDDKGESRISVEDFAIAFLDEVETPRHIHRRFTLGY